MSTSSHTPLHRVEPERLLHQHGEALLRRDFADQSDQDDQLRWWHNRALHSAYGVVEGLTVKQLTPGAQAKVSAGVAFDAFGRELILPEPWRVAVPETGEELLLVLTYDRAQVACGERSRGLCESEAIAAAGVQLRWVGRARFTLRDGVPIALLNPGKQGAGSWVRPLARPQARPRIAHGHMTIHNESQFDPWKEGNPANTVGIQFDIDTSGAGFTTVPCYFIEVTVHPTDPPPLAFLFMADIAHIHAPKADQFTVRLIEQPRFLIGRRGRDRFQRPSPELHVSWMGIEHQHPAGEAGDLHPFTKGGDGDELHP